MFQKVLEYAGEYRKTTYLSMVVMLIGIVMNVLPFLFIYQLIRPLLLGIAGAWIRGVAGGATTRSAGSCMPFCM